MTLTVGDRLEIHELLARHGHLVDEASLGFACGAVEALIREIRLHRAAEAAER